jgi:hypothetical protein
MWSMRQRLAWGLVAPLALVGTFVAHELAYRLALPDENARAQALAASGHGYLEYAPQLIAVLAGIALLGFAARVTGRGPSAPPWAVALVPFVAFTLQEHGERLAQHGAVDWAVAVEPTFLVGLALQLPFALLAALLADLLGRAADRIGRALERFRSQRWPAAAALLAPVAIVVPRPVALASCAAQRGPPPSR